MKERCENCLHWARLAGVDKVISKGECSGYQGGFTHEAFHCLGWDAEKK